MSRPLAKNPTYSLTPRNGIYYVQWWQDGAAKRTSCRTANLDEAKVFRETLISALGTPPPPVSPTVGAVLTAYEELKDGKLQSKTLGYCKKALCRHLADVPVASLNTKRIDGYICSRRTEGAGGAPAQHRKKAKTISDGTLRRELSVLKAALAWAKRDKWVLEEPYFSLPATQSARTRWLTKNEARRLIESAIYPHVRTFIALALFTAARRGAILDLTWDRVDLKGGFIHFKDGVVRNQKRRVTVPIVADLIPFLREAQVAATCAFVIERKSKPVASVNVGVRGAAERAGVAGATPHIFRATAATWMIQGGTPVKMVADWLGDTEAMVERHYGRHSPTWMAGAAASLSLRSAALGDIETK